MTVSLQGDTIYLFGTCGVEEAETLVSLILSNATAMVDVSAAEAVHTALWQALLMLAPRVSGEPRDNFVREWIMPILTAPK